MFATKAQVDKHVSSIVSKLKDQKEKFSRGYQFAKLYFDVKDYAAASRWLESFSRVKDYHAPASDLRGKILEAQGDKVGALAAYKQSYELDRTSTFALLKICELSFEVEGGSEGARFWVEKLESAYPNHKMLFRLKEKIYHNSPKKNPDDLGKLLCTELMENPSDANLRVKYVTYLADHTSKGRDEAIRYCIESEQNIPHPDSPQWYRCLLNNLETKEKISESVKPSVERIRLHAMNAALRLCVPLGGASVVDCQNLLIRFDAAMSRAKLFDSAFMEEMESWLHLHAFLIVVKMIDKGASSMTIKDPAMVYLAYMAYKNIGLTNPSASSVLVPGGDQLAQCPLTEHLRAMALRRRSEAGHILLTLLNGRSLESIIQQFDAHRQEGKSSLRKLVSELHGKAHESSDNSAIVVAEVEPEITIVDWDELLDTDLATCIACLRDAHVAVWLLANRERNEERSSNRLTSRVATQPIWFPERDSVLNLAMDVVDRSFISLPITPAFGPKAQPDSHHSPETLSRIDVLVFLLLSSASVARSHAAMSSSGLPHFLSRYPPSELLPSPDQRRWWSALVDSCSVTGSGSSSVGQRRLVLQRGIDVIRLRGRPEALPSIVPVTAVMLSLLKLARLQGGLMDGASDAIADWADHYANYVLERIASSRKSRDAGRAVPKRMTASATFFPGWSADGDFGLDKAALDEIEYTVQVSRAEVAEIMDDWEKSSEWWKKATTTIENTSVTGTTGLSNDLDIITAHHRLGKSLIRLYEISDEEKENKKSILTRAQMILSKEKDSTGSRRTDVAELLRDLGLVESYLADVTGRDEEAIISGQTNTHSSETSLRVTSRLNGSHTTPRLNLYTPDAFSRPERDSRVEMQLRSLTGLLERFVSTQQQPDSNRQLVEANLSLSNRLIEVERQLADTQARFREQRRINGQLKAKVQELQMALMQVTSRPYAAANWSQQWMMSPQAAHVVSQLQQQQQQLQQQQFQQQLSAMRTAQQQQQQEEEEEEDYFIYDDEEVEVLNSQGITEASLRLAQQQSAASASQDYTLPSPGFFNSSSTPQRAAGPSTIFTPPSLADFQKSIAVAKPSSAAVVSPTKASSAAAVVSPVKASSAAAVVVSPVKSAVFSTPSSVAAATKSPLFSLSHTDAVKAKESPKAAEPTRNASGGPEDFEPDVQFKPAVESLPELVATVTGEESEERLFEERARLYRFDKESDEWKTRGTGDFRILAASHKARFRIVMRRDQVKKLCANHCIAPEIRIQPFTSAAHAVMWAVRDYADGDANGVDETLAVRFKNEEILQRFLKIFADCQAKLRSKKASSERAPDSSVKKAEVKPDKQKEKDERPKADALKPLSELFKKKEGQWTCEVCVITNEPDRTTCAACETPKPGAAKPAAPKVSLPFGLPATSAAGSGSKVSPIRFGAPTTTAAKPLSETFGFGSVTSSTLFSTNGSNSSKDKPILFGVPKTQGSGAAAPLFGAPQATTSQPATATKPFCFGPSATTQTQAANTPVTAASPTKTFMFGQSNTSPSAASAPIVFGASTTPVQQKAQPATTGSFIFGKPSTSPQTALSSTKAGIPVSNTPSKSSTMQPTSRPSSSPIKFGPPIVMSAPFVRSPSQRKDSRSDDDSNVEEENDNLYFKPILERLPEKVESITGEEGETVLFDRRSKLFRWKKSDNKEECGWRERGIGQLKILQTPATGKARVVMRREQVLKVCCNHQLTPSLTLKSMSSSGPVKAWTWYAMDFSESTETYELFAVRFKDEKDAKEFFDVFNMAKTGGGGGEASLAAESSEKSPNKDSAKPSVDDDVVFVRKEPSVNEEQAKRAERLQLPEHFYAFENSSSSREVDSEEEEKIFAAFHNRDCKSGDGSSARPGPSSGPPVTGVQSLFAAPSSTASTGKSLFSPAMVGRSSFSSPSTANSLSLFPSPSTTAIAQSSSPAGQTFSIPASTSPLVSKPAPSTTSVFPKPASFSMPTSTAAASNALFPKAGASTALSNSFFSKPVSSAAPATLFSTPTASTTSSNVLFPKPAATTVSNSPKPAASTTTSNSLFSKPTPSAAPTSLFSQPTTTTGDSKEEKPSATKSLFSSLPPLAGSSNIQGEGFFGKTIFGAGSSMPSFKDLATNKSDRNAPPSGGIFGASGGGLSFQSLASENQATSRAEKPSGSDKFQWTGAGKPLFANKTETTSKAGKSPSKDDGEAAGTDAQEDDDGPNFEPIIPLPELVKIRTGEEGEEVLFRHRCRLYKFADNQWKERGIGDMKILKRPEDGRCRMVMRREQVHKICCNQIITAARPELLKMVSSNNGLCWYAKDYTESSGGADGQFAIRFKLAKELEEFQECVNSCKKLAASLPPSDTPKESPPAAATTSTEVEGKSVSEQREAEEEEDDDEEEEVEIWFSSAAVMTVKEDDASSESPVFSGRASLRLVYDDDVCGGRIQSSSIPEGSSSPKTLCNHIVTVEVRMGENRDECYAIWSALDFSEDEPQRRVFMVKFDNVEDFEEFRLAYDKAQTMAIESELYERHDCEEIEVPQKV